VERLTNVYGTLVGKPQGKKSVVKHVVEGKVLLKLIYKVNRMAIQFFVNMEIIF
jgi:hypothetical protein